MDRAADRDDTLLEREPSPSPFGELQGAPAADLVFANVMRPRIPLVYLDLNHLIAFARVSAGRSTAPPGSRRLWETAMRAAQERRAMFPLSAEHVWEILKITDPKQRAALVRVIEPLTGFNYIMGRATLAELELEAGIARITGESLGEIALPLVRPTIGHAFGMVGGLRIRDESGRDITEETRNAEGPDFNQRLALANQQFERLALSGPNDQELQQLQLDPGYKPEVARAARKSRVEFEVATAELLNRFPEWRKGRLRDFIAGREIVHEWLELINRHVADRSGSRFDPTDDQMQRLLKSMPSVQVAISIKTVMHRNPRHVWVANDITDIDALSIAHAYCEAVFTDKAARNKLLRARELRPLRTFVPRTPDELAEWLDGLPHVTLPSLMLPHPLPGRMSS